MIDNEIFSRIAATIEYHLQMYCHPDWVVLCSNPTIECHLSGSFYYSTFCLEYISKNNSWHIDAENVPFDMLIKINRIISNIEQEYEIMNERD